MSNANKTKSKRSQRADSSLAAIAKWILLWIVGYSLGLVTPKEPVVARITHAPNVDISAIWTPLPSKVCGIMTLAVVSREEEISSVDLSAVLPVQPVDMQISSMGDNSDTGYTGGAFWGDTSGCHFKHDLNERDPLGVTRSLHGMSNTLFDLHADRIKSSIPLFIAFSFPNQSPRPNSSTITIKGSYQRFYLTLTKYFPLTSSNL